MKAQSFTVPLSLERARLRIYAMQLLLDGAMLLAGFALSTWLYLGSPSEDSVWGSAQLALPLFWTVALLNRTYSVQALIAPEFGVQRAALALLLASLLVLMVLFLARSSLNLSRFGFGLGCISALFLIVWTRYNMEPVVRHWVGARAINLLLIDDGGPALDLPDCYRIDAARFGVAPQLDNPHGLDRLAKLIGPMDRVIVSCPPERRRAWAMVLKGAHMRGEIVDNEVIDLGILGTSRSEGVGTLVPSAFQLLRLARSAHIILSLPLSLKRLPVLAAAGRTLVIAHPIRIVPAGKTDWKAKAKLKIAEHLHGIVPSRYLAEHFPGSFVIANPYDTATFDPGRNNPEAKRGGIVHVGRLIPGKGAHVLIDAFARIATEFPTETLR